MVTATTQKSQDVSFTHMVDVPKSRCIVGTAREKSTGKTRLFLIFNHEGRIYARNGLKGTWEELSREDSEQIGSLVQQALRVNSSIPHYTTNHSLGFQN